MIRQAFIACKYFLLVLLLELPDHVQPVYLLQGQVPQVQLAEVLLDVFELAVQGRQLYQLFLLLGLDGLFVFDSLTTG